MGDDSWRREPLGDKIEQYHQQVSSRQGFLRALNNWNRIKIELDSGPRVSNLRAQLSESQYNSFRILLEWWNGSIQEQSLSQAVRDALEEATDSRHAESQFCEIDAAKARTEESAYHNVMFLLFELEFLHEMRMLQTKEHGAFLGFVQGQRERGAQYAAMQRVAYSFLQDTQISNSRGSYHEHYPMDARQQSPSLFNLLGQNPGACIESCPWLKIRENSDNSPYYLWDVTQKRTIVVNELNYCPKYVCVSHTWGRWRIDSEPEIWLTGVPWSIPQNTKFTVQSLPDQLLAAFQEGFVWFDLLCIPQDRSERALIEISRQAAIFGNAASVVAWLNDTTSWTGLRNAMKWFSLLYLHFSTYVRDGTRKANEMPEPADDLFEHDMELYLPDPDDVAEGETEMLPEPALEPLPWFSSLWTLQEACLRPDMVLCNKKWEPLAAATETLVPLDHIVALSNFIFKGTFLTAMGRKSDNPSEDKELEELALDLLLPGCEDLMDLLKNTCLYDLNWISQGTVFTFGQLRHCSEHRAEAIMSVIGATDWYTTHVERYGTPPPEDELVLGYYPASFLAEAMHKIGPTFFTAAPSDLRYLYKAVELSRGSWVAPEDAEAIGSLLPFTRSPTHLQPPQKYAPSVWNHPSISDWQIQPNGSFRIQQVGILTFEDNDAIEKIEDDWITAPIPDDEGSVTLDSEVQLARGDLEDWLREFGDPKKAPNYAVCLYQQIYLSQDIPGPQAGILLKQVKVEGSQVTLVKVGLYLTYSCFARNVPTTAVDWIVL